MTAPVVYRSTDASAPVLTGASGSLVALLHAVLVAGYGSGAQASGAGWTSAYTATNKEAYRNSATDGTGFYLNVDDTDVGTTREGFVVGFETMSAISTGTGQFPTSAQINLALSAPAGALVCRKSATQDGTARPWTIIADNTFFALFVETGDYASPTMAMPFMFGDFFSYKASDPYRCMIIARNITNSNSFNNEGFSALHSNSASSFLTQTMIGHYIARSWTGLGSSVGFGKHVDHGKLGQFGANASLSGTNTLSGNTTFPMIGSNPANPGAFPFPNAVDGGMLLSPIWLHHNGAVRGYLKGLWAPLHDRPLNHNDTYSGTGNMSGKSFLSQSILCGRGSAIDGQVHIETSNTWG